MKKRWFKTVTAIVMAGALLAGCGTSGNSSSTAAADGETQAEAAEGTKTYTMFMRGTFVDWISELKWYDEAEKRTGVHVEYVKGPDSQEDAFAEVDQRLISGTLTDATFCRQAQANVYGAQGAFRDLAPLIKEYAPNIQKYLDENPEYAALVTNEDGTIYGLLNETPRLANFCFYRADHFREAGVDPASIVTVDDFTDVMRTLKAYYGKDNPNYYPLCGRESYFLFSA